MNTMNMKKFTTIAIWAALLLAAPVQAVNKYSCDFESVTDRERWVLNPAANQDICIPGRNTPAGPCPTLVPACRWKRLCWQP